ncbi:MAG: NADH-quinone oxidoreductase subunit G [Paraglaciecola sp.]|jgi:NADH-quinone oxidoreductase subunit G
MAKIYIDKQQYNVKDGQNLLQACLSLKLDLPYFCWHPAMGSVGACRQCAMTQYQDENDSRGRMIVACMTPVSEGMHVSMNQAPEKEFRDQVIGALMTHHPHDCPVCTEGGECHLQDMTVMAGHHERKYKGKKTTFKNQELGPLVKHEMNRCITCYRCERFYKDYAGGTDLSAQASKNNVYFGRQQDGILQSEFAGNLVEVCPTGVFTDKPFGDHYSRKWDMQSAPSVCQHCSVGCNTTVSERYGSVRRVTNRLNDHLNGYFLCDRGRYGFDFVNSEHRARDVYLDGQVSSWREPAAQVNLKDKGQWLGIGSTQASLEDNFTLQQLVGADNFCASLDPQQESLLAIHTAILNQWSMASLAEMEQADAILILGEDVNNSAPRIALSLRQALMNNAKQQAEKLRIPSWQDAAVRAILSHYPVPLAYMGYGENDLSKQASIRLVCDDKRAAEQGFLLANLLSDSAPLPKSSKVDKQTQALVDMLKSAKRPLIITGWSANNPALLAAACNLRKALAERNKENKQAPDQAMICIVPPESNTLGMGLLMQQGGLSCQQLEERVASDKCNLLVLDHSKASFSQQLAKLRLRVNKVVRLMQMGSGQKGELSLPVSSFSESSGSQLNYQGLIQSHIPATKPSGQCMPAWQWLVNIAKLKEHELAHIGDLGQLRDKLAATYPQLAQHWQQHHKSQLALQTPRVSGRTAMLANQTVHEPKPFSESSAPYKQSMEGCQIGQDNEQPLAYSWSPGWNSNQSNHKFKDEYRATELGEQKGLRCIAATDKKQWCKWQASWSKTSKKKWKVLPLQKVFGSDSLSLHALPVAQLKASAQLVINARQGQKMDLHPGQFLCCDNEPIVFQLVLSKQVPTNTMLIYVPGDQYFSLTSCDELKVATAKQIKGYAAQRKATHEGLLSSKERQNKALLAQDQTIPIHFIEGLV